MLNILVVDSDINWIADFRERLMEKGYTIQHISDVNKVLEYFSQKIIDVDTALIDVNFFNENRIDRIIQENHTGFPMILISDSNDSKTAINWLRRGIFDVWIRPLEFREMLALLLRIRSYKKENERLLKNSMLYEERNEIVLRSNRDAVDMTIDRIKSHLGPILRLHHINADHILVCLQEALTNAVLHGNFEIPALIKEDSWDQFEQLVLEREANSQYANRKVVFSYVLNNQQLAIKIQDEGKGFNHQAAAFKDSKKRLYSGRGILMIHHYMDEVSWNEPGNCIQMKKFF